MSLSLSPKQQLDFLLVFVPESQQKEINWNLEFWVETLSFKQAG